MMTVSQLDPKHVDRRIGGLEMFFARAVIFDGVDRRIGGLEKDEGAGQRYSRVDRRIGGLENHRLERG